MGKYIINVINCIVIYEKISFTKIQNNFFIIFISFSNITFNQRYTIITFTTINIRKKMHSFIDYLKLEGDCF